MEDNIFLCKIKFNVEMLGGQFYDLIFSLKFYFNCRKQRGVRCIILPDFWLWQKLNYGVWKVDSIDGNVQRNKKWNKNKEKNNAKLVKQNTAKN